MSESTAPVQEYSALPTNISKSNTSDPALYVPFPFNILRNSFWFGIGYTMELIDRNSMIQKNITRPLYRVDKAEGWAAGIQINHMSGLTHDLDDLVRPSIKIHAVNIESGRYIKSAKRSVCLPLRTRNASLKDVSSIPQWNEELILDAQFYDIIHPNTLLLFEMFDDHPSLTALRQASSKSTPIPVAWGYLLPISQSGVLHCRILDEWDPMTSNAESSTAASSATTIPKAQTRRQRRASAMNGDNPTDNVSNSSETQPTTSSSTASQPTSNMTRIQLFRYIYDDGMIGFIQRKIMGWPSLLRPKKGIHDTSNTDDDTDDNAYPDGIPPVYLQYRSQRHHQIPSSWLSIAIAPRQLSLAIGYTPSIAAHRRDSLDPRLNKSALDLLEESQLALLTSKDKDGIAKARAALFQRLRAPDEPCAIPCNVLHRLDVGPEGAIVVKYSWSGHLLAVACKSTCIPIYMQNNSLGHGDVYAVKLYDTDTGREIWHEDAAHYSAIFDLTWTKDDSYLASCGGDGIVKVWDMLSLVPSLPDADIDTEHPTLCHTYHAIPPTPIYCIIFQEYSSSIKKSDVSSTELYYDKITNQRIPCPSILTGAADGRIRIWSHDSNMAGYLHLGSNNAEMQYEPAHRYRVQSLSINERSRYLFSGDASGEVLIWRLDNHNHYQLLRKLRRDNLISSSSATLMSTSPITSSSSIDMMNHSASGVMTIAMHPDKKQNQMLVFQHQPSQMKVYNLTNYRSQCICASFIPAIHATGKTIFQRATLSADGRYTISGTAIRSSNTAESHHSAGTSTGNDHDRVVYRLNIWDSQTGAIIRTALSDFLYPYPVRSIAWHPKQHALAVAFAGERAAVVVYAGMKEDAGNVTNRINSSIIAGFNSSNGGTGDEVVDNDKKDDSSLPLLPSNRSTASQNDDPADTRSLRAKEIMDRVKAAKL